MRKIVQNLKDNRIFRDLALYFVVGALATAVEWVVFFITNNPLGLHYAIAVVVAFSLSTIANWWFGRLILFKDSKKTLKVELSQIYITSLIGLLVNLLIMWIAVDLIGINEMLSKVIATGIVFFWNFIIRKCVIYNNSFQHLQYKKPFYKIIQKEYKNFCRKINLKTRRQRVIFIVLFAILLLYIETIIIGQFLISGIHSKLLLVIMMLIGIITTIFLVTLIGSRINNTKLSSRTLTRKKYCQILFIVFFVTFLVFLLYQWAFWPGMFNPDTATQYMQAIGASEWTDWHPAINTFLFFWLPMRIHESLASVVLFQNICFSLSVAYFCITMYRLGVSRKFVFLGWLLIVINPNIGSGLLNPVKDYSLMFLALILVTFIVQIFQSQGNWLRRKRNIVLFIIISLLVCLVRHNSILFVVPIFIIVFFAFRSLRKIIAFSSLIILILAVVIRGPIYTLANIKPAWNRQMEMLGVPMTIISDAYVLDPSALSKEGQKFLSSLVPESVWHEKYQIGNFNSIKWPEGIGLIPEDKNPIEQEGANKILRYATEVFIHNPYIAFKSLAQITSVGWMIDGGNGNHASLLANEKNSKYIMSVNPQAKLEFHNQNGVLRSFFLSINDNFSKYFVKYLFNFPGIILLLIFILSVSRVGHTSLSRILIAVCPTFIYGIGTMLMLTGPSMGYFMFLFPVSIALIFLLFAKSRK